MTGRRRKTDRKYAEQVTFEFRSGVPGRGEPTSCILCGQGFNASDTWQKVSSPDQKYWVSVHNRCAADQYKGVGRGPASVRGRT